MDDNKSDYKGLDNSWSHLFLRDKRSPEEQARAEQADRDRRRGKGRKDWWKKYLPPEAPK